MNLTKIISIALLLGSLGLAYYLYYDIDSTIQRQKAVKEIEEQIIEKLSFIREAESLYLDYHGDYTSNWDTLKHFVLTGQAPITVRHERVVTLSYGADSSIIRVDTIGYESIKDKLYKETINLNCQKDGTFLGFSVSEGESVLKNAVSYKIRLKSNGKTEEYKFLEAGQISKLAKIEPGTEISKGTLLITMWKYAFDPTMSVEDIELVPVPEGEEPHKFEIITKQLSNKGVPVDAIKVWDPQPINNDRKAPKLAEGRKSYDWTPFEEPESGKEIPRNKITLNFGSTIDATTLGNWE